MTTTTPAPRARVETAEHLHGPRSDFWALGGASLILVPLLLLLPAASLEDEVLTITIVLSILINHPHFAVSYQIFYADYRRKIDPSASSDPTLHLRYLFAGLVVPALLGAYFLVTILGNDAVALGYGFNLMRLFVGWHYVKQGYGMAMVDAALKKRFFDDTEKRTLRINAYAAWAAAWVTANRISDDEEFLGVPFEMFDIPDPVFATAIGALTVSTLATARLFLRRARSDRPLPWTGVVAYAISLYPWMVFLYYDALLLLVVPALHSIQYLWVVSRYQQNRAAAEPDAPTWSRAYGWSVGLGLMLFWVAPLLLDTVGPYDAEVMGEFAFMFAFWVIINVHHYFMDNVMWRRGNPDVNRYLFGR